MIQYHVVEDPRHDSHRFTSPKGEISLVGPCEWTGGEFEIYCIEGGLFEDVERFTTLDKAMERIRELLS